MNSEELQKEWQRVCEVVQNNETVDASQTSAFFSRLQPQAMSDGFLMLTADNEFIKNWVEKHYSLVIKQALKELRGSDFIVAIEVDENQQPPAQIPSNLSSSLSSSAVENAPDAPEKPHDSNRSTERPEPEITEKPTGIATGIEQSQQQQDQTTQPDKNSIDSDILMPTSSLTFENFVIGASNQMAYSVAVAVAEEPGRQMLNPLFIYGKSGLGKTHLMRAIQNYVAETRPELTTVYVDSADFLSGYVEATVIHDKEKGSYKNFKRPYEDADILLIDDIQYLQGKEQTLDIVFQIFKTLTDEGKQVVLSADRAPKNITMDERFQSRFNSGGTFDIQPPEVETKLGIIKSFIDEYRTTSNQPNFRLDSEIERYIAENSSSNIRELKSAVTKVIYTMNTLKKDDISADEVSRLLENHFSGGAMKKLNIGDIQKQVELYYDVPHSDLIGQKRSRRIVYARQIAIYLSREMLDLPYNYIAKSFGGRDHTTIMYSVTSVEDKMRDSREIREEIENIKRRIKEM